MITEIKNSYWVVPGLIAAGPFPGALEEFKYKMRLNTLFDSGIRVFINLQEPGEMLRSKQSFVEDYSPVFRTILEKKKINEACGGLIKRFPIPDKDVPSVELMKEILNTIDSLHKEKAPLYIHCWGGIGRTGTVVGCWLMRHGLAQRNNVLDKIFDLRRSQVDPTCLAYNSPETDSQEQFILKWEKGV